MMAAMPGSKAKTSIRGRLKGLRPFKTTLPLSLKGEGDTGGEVDSESLNKDRS
jgi:hypothetical protein